MTTKTIKTKKVTRSLSFAIVIAFVFIFTSVFGNNLVVKAADEVEKKIVQNAQGWTIFQYADDEGRPTLFDILFYDQTVEELEADGSQLQYRVMFKDDSSLQFYIYSWTNIGEQISDTFAQDIYNSTEHYYIQFRLYEEDTTDESLLPVSFTFPLYDEELPYILDSTTYKDSYYDLRSNPNQFSVILRISEPLEQTENLSITVSADREDRLDFYSASNIQFENVSEEYSIGDKVYTAEYSIVVFDVTLSPTCISSWSESYFFYSFKLNGFKGINSEKEPSNLLMYVCTPSKSTTEAPTTEAPTTEQPTTEAPTTEAPTTEQPTTETPTTEQTTTQQPTTEQPTTEAPVKVTKVKITGSATAVKAGKKLTLKASVTPDNATNSSVTWSSSNEKYATVNANGVVTTKKAGLGKTVKITATANDGSGVKATYKVKIVKATVTKIKISASSKNVKAGEKVNLKVTIKPTNVTTQKVTWSSSNKKYATVTSKGIVTTKKAGAGKTVTITAKAKDGSGKKATVKIKIKK